MITTSVTSLNCVTKLWELGGTLIHLIGSSQFDAMAMMPMFSRIGVMSLSMDLVSLDLLFAPVITLIRLDA